MECDIWVVSLHFSFNMSSGDPDVRNSSSGNVAFEVEVGSPTKADSNQVQKLERRMKSYGSRPKTPQMIQEKLHIAEERRKVQSAF